jgi:hypothetical protein
MSPAAIPLSSTEDAIVGVCGVVPGRVRRVREDTENSKKKKKKKKKK